MNAKSARYTQRLPSGVIATLEVWREGSTLCHRLKQHTQQGAPVTKNPSISDYLVIQALFEKARKENANENRRKTG